MIISDDLHAKVKSVAALSGRKLYQLVEDALQAEVERFETERARKTKRSTS